MTELLELIVAFALLTNDVLAIFSFVGSALMLVRTGVSLAFRRRRYKASARIFLWAWVGLILGTIGLASLIITGNEAEQIGVLFGLSKSEISILLLVSFLLLVVVMTLPLIILPGEWHRLRGEGIGLFRASDMIQAIALFFWVLAMAAVLSALADVLWAGIHGACCFAGAVTLGLIGPVGAWYISQYYSPETGQRAWVGLGLTAVIVLAALAALRWLVKEIGGF